MDSLEVQLGILDRKRAGRPVGGWATLERSLSPFERRVALMHLADASYGAIAYALESTVPLVNDILHRPHVQRFVFKMQGEQVEDLKRPMQDLTRAIDQKAERAFEVETDAMEELASLDPGDMKTLVRARVGAAQIAQDILDRAGKRAPTKIEQKRIYEIPDKTIDALERIVGQAAIDVTPNEEG